MSKIIRTRTRDVVRDLAIGCAMADHKSLRAIAKEQGISFQRVDQLVIRLHDDVYLTARRPAPGVAMFRRIARQHPVMFKRVLEGYAKVVLGGR